MSYFQMVEEAWDLSDAARAYVAAAGRDVDLAELWEKVFTSSPLVDVVQTRKEGGPTSGCIFLKSPYGLRYREDTKDWIPFRHAPIDMSNATAISR